MAELIAQGRVIETRDGLIVLKEPGSVGETTHEVRKNDAAPGNYVFIYDDGQVESVAHAVEPADIALPTKPDPEPTPPRRGRAAAPEPQTEVFPDPMPEAAGPQPDQS